MDLKKALLLAFLFFHSPYFALYANNYTLPGGGAEFIIPEDIGSVFFPYGNLYQIPDNNRIDRFIKKAEDFEKRGDYKNAYRYYTIAANRAKNSKTAPYILFKRAFLVNSNQQAVRDLIYIYRKYPDFPLIDAVEYEIACRYYLSGNFKESERYVKTLKDKDSPLWPYAFILKSSMEFIQKDYEKAISSSMESLEKLYELNDRALEYQIMLCLMLVSRSLIEKDELSKGRKLLKKIIGTTKNSSIRSKAIYELLKADLALGNYEEASLCYYTLKDNYRNTVSMAAAEELKRKNSWEIADRQSLKGMKIGIYCPEILTGLSREKLLNGGICQGIKTVGVQTEAGDRVDSEKVVGKDKTVKSSGGDFVIQLGSFKNKENAERLMQTVHQKGFSAFIEITEAKGGKLYRVRIGPFKTKEEASGVLGKIKNTGLSGIIISIKE